jgi:2TM domain
MNDRDDFAGAKKARIGFAIHLTVYLVVNALLVAINLTTSTQYLWFKWPLLGWGIGVFFHALAIFGLSRGAGSKNG